jgi:hypothetical protein
MAHDPPPAAVPATAEAEAARYALLRRLAPSMRHHLVVNLQPIGMIYEVMERRLRAPEPDLGQLHESAHKINGFAKAALASCTDVIGWLAPDASATTTLADGVRECAGLMATSLGFRGYVLRPQVTPAEGELRRSAVRTLLTAGLMHVTDERPPPAELVLGTEDDGACARIHLALQATEGESGFAAEPPYRKLTWSDLQALAVAEGAAAERNGDRITLVLPWVRT